MVVPTAEPRAIQVRVLVASHDVGPCVRHRAVNAPTACIHADFFGSPLDPHLFEPVNRKVASRGRATRTAVHRVQLEAIEEDANPPQVSLGSNGGRSTEESRGELRQPRNTPEQLYQ